jgi:hypothetical protein
MVASKTTGELDVRLRDRYEDEEQVERKREHASKRDQSEGQGGDAESHDDGRMVKQ